ncbi:MAG: hypothetical protein ACLP7J_30040 [Streptosporangiaceae bacterium]
MTRFFPAFASRARPPDSDFLMATVGAEGNRLRALLAVTDPAGLSADQVRADVEGNLWMLAPEAFRYFLPAFLNLAVEHYDSLGNFAAELIGALTEPLRADVLQALDRAAQIPAEMGLTPDTLRQLRQQQLDWYDSGTPLATYQERIADLSAAEAEAILDFLATIRDTHGEDFPFDEPQVAIDRYRARRPAG